jgi:hypothetical protein
MQKLIGLTLLAFCKLTFAGVVIPITFYNYFSNGGTVFIGTTPQLFGPVIGLDGNSVQMSAVVNGVQLVGLQVGNTPEICWLTTGQLALNAALYQPGETVSVVYGQPQNPSGITCGCTGSAACVQV